jgi:hypothetical protein
MKIGPKNKIKMKNKKKSLIIIFNITLLLILISLYNVSANFVCGQVNDSKDSMSANWYDVNIYRNDFNKYGVCEVSPSENKYCCDLDLIPTGWSVGDEIFVEVVDFENNYVTNLVSKIANGEGFIVMPEMKLEKVILVEPNKNLFIENNSLINFSFSFKEPYTQVEINLNNQSNNFNSSNLNLGLDLNFGFNQINLSAENGDRIFYENKEFYLLNNVEINKEYLCEKCKGKKIKNDREVDVVIKLNLSHLVKDIELIEYVPIDFEVLETNGIIKSYSSSHNQIVWNIEGKEIEKYYKFKAPSITLFPQEYLVNTYLEDYTLNSDMVNIRRFFSFFPNVNDFEEQILSASISYAEVSNQKPLIYRPKTNISRLIIFPKTNILETGFELIQNEKLDNEIESYLINTDFEINEILIELNVDPEFSNKQIYLVTKEQEILLTKEQGNKYSGSFNSDSFSIKYI